MSKERARRRQPWFVGLVWGGAYLAITLTVLLVELRSEHDKLDSGTYTDTFDALVFGRLVTLPGALMVPGTTPDDRGALNDAAWQLGGVALGQAVAVGALAVTLSWLSAARRSDTTRHSGATTT